MKAIFGGKKQNWQASTYESLGRRQGHNLPTSAEERESCPYKGIWGKREGKEVLVASFPTTNGLLNYSKVRDFSGLYISALVRGS